MDIRNKGGINLKKLGRVDGKVYRKNVYSVIKDGVQVFEGTTDEVIKYLNVNAHVFNTIMWRCRKNKKPLKYKGHVLKLTQKCIGERVFAVVSQLDGKEVLRGSLRKIAAEYKYKMGSLRNYVTRGKPILIRRKKYDLVPTGEYDIIWKRVR